MEVEVESAARRYGELYPFLIVGNIDRRPPLVPVLKSRGHSRIMAMPRP